METEVKKKNTTRKKPCPKGTRANKKGECVPIKIKTVAPAPVAPAATAPAATAPDVTIIFAADVTSGISVTKDLFPLPPAVTTPVAPPKPPAPPLPVCTYNISGNKEA